MSVLILKNDSNMVKYSRLLLDGKIANKLRRQKALTTF